jgi:hypothetical protein
VGWDFRLFPTNNRLSDDGDRLPPERCLVRRVVGLAVALLLVAPVGCSTDDSMAVEIAITYPNVEYSQPVPTLFSASGVAVDEGIVCESGTMEVDHLESPEGVTITSEEGGALNEAARADEGVMDSYRVQEFVCDDGSGTFTMRVHSRVDFAKPESEQDIPTWEIENGTGDYAALSGSGDTTTEFSVAGDAVVAYTGQVQTG